MLVPATAHLALLQLRRPRLRGLHVRLQRQRPGRRLFHLNLVLLLPVRKTTPLVQSQRSECSQP